MRSLTRFFEKDVPIKIRPNMFRTVPVFVVKSRLDQIYGVLLDKWSTSSSKSLSPGQAGEVQNYAETAVKKNDKRQSMCLGNGKEARYCRRYAICTSSA